MNAPLDITAFPESWWQDYIPAEQHQSRYDKIHKMNDVELAEWIETIAECNHCPILEKVQKKPIRETCRGEKAVSRYSCMKHWLDWLREEIKDD